MKVEFTECRRSKREFYYCSQALVVTCLEHLRPLRVPLRTQPVAILCVMRGSGGE